MITKNNLFKFFWIIVLVLIVDQGTKWWVHTYLPKMSWLTLLYPYGGIAIFKDFFGVQFSIIHETNQGAAWGSFADYAPYLLVIRVGLIVILSVYLLFISKNPSIQFPLSLIIAGAIGNVLDILWYSHVIDMFYFKFGSYSYPVFNIADSVIFIGVFWLVIQSFFQKKRS